MPIELPEDTFDGTEKKWTYRKPGTKTEPKVTEPIEEPPEDTQEEPIQEEPIQEEPIQEEPIQEPPEVSMAEAIEEE
ncbi:MAG: hypothetical protein ACFFBU_09435 [Promethearchaeota archaeon]